MERGYGSSTAGRPQWKLAVEARDYDHLNLIWNADLFNEVIADCRQLVAQTIDEDAHGRARIADSGEPNLGDVGRLAMWAASRAGRQLDTLRLWDEGIRAGWLNRDCFKTRIVRGWALINTGRPGRSLELVKEMMACGEQKMPQGEFGELLFLSGWSEWQLGDSPGKARSDLRRALAVFNRLDDSQQHASVNNALAVIETRCFSLREADRLLTEAGEYLRRSSRYWHPRLLPDESLGLPVQARTAQRGDSQRRRIGANLHAVGKSPHHAPPQSDSSQSHAAAGASQ